MYPHNCVFSYDSLRRRSVHPDVTMNIMSQKTLLAESDDIFHYAIVQLQCFLAHCKRCCQWRAVSLETRLGRWLRRTICKRLHSIECWDTWCLSSLLHLSIIRSTVALYVHREKCLLIFALHWNQYTANCQQQDANSSFHHQYTIFDKSSHRLCMNSLQNTLFS